MHRPETLQSDEPVTGQANAGWRLGLTKDFGNMGLPSILFSVKACNLGGVIRNAVSMHCSARKPCSLCHRQAFELLEAGQGTLIGSVIICSACRPACQMRTSGGELKILTKCPQTMLGFSDSLQDGTMRPFASFIGFDGRAVSRM